MLNRSTLLIVLALLFPASRLYAANLPPTVTPIADQTVAEAKALNLTVSASDPEGSPITFTGRAFKTWMSMNGSTFTATPSLNDAGTYTVTINASDGVVSSSVSFTLTVTNVNQAPAINPISNKTVSEGGTLSFQVSTSDPDRDVVTVTAAPLKSWMTFDGKTFTAKPGYADSGAYVVTFTASDGASSAQTQTTLTVNQVNQAPTFSTAASHSVGEGRTLTLPIVASDPDGDLVTITAAGLKPWMTFDGHTFSATPDYVDEGTYSVTFTASDSVKQTKLSVTLTVANTNRAPVLTNPGNWEIGDGKVLSIPLIATDPDGDLVTITATGLRPWMSFDGKVFRARPAAGTTGAYNITFTASDASLKSRQSITVTVVSGGAGFPAPWTSYMGSVGGRADWAAWVRHWLVESTGMNLVKDPALASSLYASAAEDLATHELMLPITGFVRDAASMSEFMNLIQDGGVASWQEAVRSEVEQMSLLDPGAQRVIYQLGNEITQSTISVNLREWAASRGIAIPGAAGSNDVDLIPYYAEYFLAPTVDKVMAASTQYFGDPLAATIALGSIGNAATADARAWLDLLLNYQIQGTYAPAQKGKYVFELVDLITVQYVASNSNLDDIWDKWKGQGRIRGLWTSEEIGSKAVDSGFGSGRALLTTGEQLSWMYKRALTPAQSRVAYYDWNLDGPVLGTSPNASLIEMYNFFSNDPLEVFAGGITVIGTAVDSLYNYRFNSVLDGNKRILVVTANFTDPGLNASVNTVQFGKEGWTGAVTATVHRFSAADGHTQVPATVIETSTAYEVQFSSASSLQGDGSALLITVQH